MTDMPVWVEAAVNDERRRLRENSRLEVLAERVDAKIAAIKDDPARERGQSEVLRLPRHQWRRGRLVEWWALVAGDLGRPIVLRDVSARGLVVVLRVGARQGTRVVLEDGLDHLRRPVGPRMSHPCDRIVVVTMIAWALCPGLLRKEACMAELTIEQLTEAVGGGAVALRSTMEMQPADGPGGKVFPPTYAVTGDHKYAVEERQVGDRVVTTVLLDSVASQANRAELALLDGWEAGDLSFPVPFVDFRGEADLDDLGRITVLEAPHRLADAIFRDSLLEGTLFRLSEMGRAITDARPGERDGLVPVRADGSTVRAVGLHRPEGRPGIEVPAGLRLGDRRAGCSYWAQSRQPHRPLAD